MSVAGNPKVSPTFIQARNKKELRRKMLMNNVKSGTQHKYFDIQPDGSFWVCWYYVNHTEGLNSEVEKILDNSSDD